MPRRLNGWSLVRTSRAVLAETARMVFPPSRLANWRHFADAAKRRRLVLRLADRLGREVGRTRFLDGLKGIPPAARRPDLGRFLAADLAAAWLGHATLLLRIGGKTILTDPVFSPRVGIGLLFATVGPRRRQHPALAIHQLPSIDLILSSHAHFDHLDRPSLWRLARRFPTAPVIAAAGTADLLSDLGFNDVRELAWGEQAEAAGLRVRAVPVKHWGPRVFYDDWRGYNAYLVETPPGATAPREGEAVSGPGNATEAQLPLREKLWHPSARLLFGGDTAFTDAWSGVGPLDLLAVGISAYDPFVAAHATPEQAWEMAQQAGARHVLPMHHTTFKLSYEPMDEPLRRLLAAAGSQAHRVVAREVGDLWVLPGGAGSLR